MYHSTNAHVYHLISMTAATTGLQTCRILVTSMPVEVGRLSGPSAAFLALTPFLAFLGNQASTGRKDPAIQLIFRHLFLSTFILQLRF